MHRHTDDDAGRRSALRQVGQAELRGHRPAQQEAHGDGRRGVSLGATLDFIDRANRDKKPFFVWFNPAACTSGPTSSRSLEGKTGLGIYADGMVEHDGQVGQLLKKLDDLGIANNTIVIYTTDNGAEVMSWPDGGTTPFRGEKNTNWEGGYRVPAMVRWPGLVQPGTEINEVFSAEDWMQTLLAAVGEPRPQGQAAAGLRRSATRPSRSISTATTSASCWRQRHRQRAQGVLLLDRRRRAGRPALRQVEARLHGAAQPRLRRLAGALW